MKQIWNNLEVTSAPYICLRNGQKGYSWGSNMPYMQYMLKSNVEFASLPIQLIYSWSDLELQELTKHFVFPSRSVSVNWSTSANSGNTGWWHHSAMPFSTWSQCCWQDIGVDETWAGSQICLCVACWPGPCEFKKSILQRKDVTLHWWIAAREHFTKAVQCEPFRQGKIQMLHSRFKYRVFRWARCR